MAACVVLRSHVFMYVHVTQMLYKPEHNTADRLSVKLRSRTAAPSKDENQRQRVRRALGTAGSPREVTG